MRDSTIFYRSFYEAINLIPEEDQLNVYKAIFEYSLNMNETELTGVQKAVFTLIKPQLDANLKRYENGKKGGKPKQKETKPKPKANQTQTKPKANANVNDNVNVNDNKKEDVFNFKKAFLDLGVEKQVLEDWLEVRKAKKAVNTKTAFDRVIAEIKKCNLSTNDCIKSSAENSWIGFNHLWLKEKEKSFGKKEKDNHVPSPLRSTPITI